MNPRFVSFLLRLLLALYYPVLLLLAVATIAFAAYLTYLAFAIPFFFLLLLPAVLLFATVFHALAVLGRWGFQRPARNQLEIRLPREEMAGLIDFVQEIARRRRLPAPSDIRLGADTIAHVYEEDDGRKILVLGGPALAGLSQPALAGIIAHELGHFAAGDTRLLRRAFRRHLAMAILETHCSENKAAHFNPLIWCMRLYHLLYNLVWAAHSRQQEFAADRHEVAEAGKKQAAASLILLTVTERLPWARLSSLVEGRIATNEPLEAAFAEQVRMVQQTSPSEWEDALRKELRQPTEPFNSHPCLKDRLAAMRVSPKRALRLALEQRGAPARDLFENWEGIEHELTERLLIPYRQAYLAKREMAQIFLGRPLERP
jgi:Zn-dependent protease with chaperone function